ncbi:MAG: hypothetical protein OWV35_09610 [Firmicutes bacterium]|nr:hypothetical protein [Bacillota bacterium]
MRESGAGTPALYRVRPPAAPPLEVRLQPVGADTGVAVVFPAALGDWHAALLPHRGELTALLAAWGVSPGPVHLMQASPPAGGGSGMAGFVGGFGGGGPPGGEGGRGDGSLPLPYRPRTGPPPGPVPAAAAPGGGGVDLRL